MLKYFFCFIIIYSLLPSWVYAWDDKQTHPDLTEEASKHAKDSEIFLKVQLAERNIGSGLEK